MKRYFIVNEYFGSRVYDSKNKTEEYYNSEDTEKIRNKLHGNFIEIDHKRTNQLSSPLKISMNITKKCNLRCKQCFTESGICLENELNTKLINKKSIKEEESVKQKEKKEKTIESSNTTDKENAMMIKIKHLEEETNDLSKLLDENKFYYLKYKEQIEQLNKKEVEISNLNVKYIKELKSKDIDLGLFRNEINEKNDIIDSLNAKIKELTEKLDIAINSNINLNKEKIELNRMINQLMENIYMNKEEISTLVIMLRNEQSQHNITKQTMISLESVISNIKEKQKRNEFITNVVNSSIK